MLNPGMAFSLLSGKQLFLIIATSVALILVAYGLFFRSRGRYLQQAALLLILAGGIGNLIDRVLNGVVVDYINLLFMQFAVFNFADICVCVGVASLGAGRSFWKSCTRRAAKGAVSHGTA